MLVKSKIFVIDDDKTVLDSLTRLFRTVHYDVDVFISAHTFLENYEKGRSECLILETRMPEMTGLELQELLLSRGVNIPLIFVTAYGDIPMAVNAMKKGAVDFLAKPVRPQKLLEAVNAALKQSAKSARHEMERQKVMDCIGLLTPREQEIMYMMVEGNTAKAIAQKLGISLKTVDVHRSHIMDKMQVKTVALLVQRVLVGSDKIKN